MRTKHRAINKKIYILSSLAIAAIIFLIIAGIFFYFSKTPASIYVSSENPKQGDTVFIRVKSESGNVTGNLGSEKLFFYKKAGLPEWVAFLGIDADQKPGDYKISVNVSMAEELTKKIKVTLANFSSSIAVAAPSSQKTGYTNQEAVQNIIKNDNPALKKVLGIVTSKPYFNEPFSFPLSTMERSGFSFGKFIEFAKYKLQHLGVDLAASEKTNVYAVNNGKVVATLNLSNYGKTVIIDHGLDIFSLYLHLDEFKVSDGQMVKRGQIIGLSGDTGYTTAPHLHFSMRVDGSRVDPIVFIEASKKLDDKFILADISNAFLNIISQIK